MRERPAGLLELWSQGESQAPPSGRARRSARLLARGPEVFIPPEENIQPCLQIERLKASAWTPNKAQCNGENVRPGPRP